MANREEMKKEAIKRMRAMRIMPQTIEEFRKSNTINKSTWGGILFWLDDEEKEIVKEFEEKYNCLVYHAIKCSYRMTGGDIMECFDLLYVSEDSDEWELDNADIKNDGIAFVYSKSNFCDGEFGGISIKPMNGGIVRVA